MNEIEIVNWLKDNFGDDVQVMIPQFERTKPLDYNFIPQTAEQFYGIVEKAPWDILKGLGFCKWDNMNSIISENKKRSIKDVVGIPIVGSDEVYSVDIGRKDNPTESLEVDEDVILIPGEWYDVIPNGFIVTGLNGEQYPFKKGESDDDIRFGCLPYGIRRVK